MWESLFKRFELNWHSIIHKKQFYRLFMYSVAHKSMQHAFVNIVVLIIFSVPFIKQFGLFSYAFIYIYSTLLIGIIVLFIYKKNNYTLCGASGTACVFIGHSLINHGYIYLFCVYLGICFFASLFHNRSYISHEAHLIGLILGVFFYYLFL